MTQQLSIGTCTFCHKVYSKSGMRRHLETCPQRSLHHEQTGNTQQEQPGKRVFLLIEEQFPPAYYWMYLAITTETTLATLDQFLRDIWLECCGHLSAFEIAGSHYCVDEALIDDWLPRQRDMRVRLDEVLQPGQTYTYEYDFGSTTELRLKVISEYDAVREGKPIQVLARNDLSFRTCNECNGAATFIYRHPLSDQVRWFCDSCARKHLSDEGMLEPRVNSPRNGVCGYAGSSRRFWQPLLSEGLSE
jgi:hypothetical protein